MPVFMILGRDRPNTSALRAETRPAHLAHIETLRDTVVRAGPFSAPDGTPLGSLILAEFEDLAAAQSFVDADPYTIAGLFEEVTVAAWRQVLP